MLKIINLNRKMRLRSADLFMQKYSSLTVTVLKSRIFTDNTYKKDSLLLHVIETRKYTSFLHTESTCLNIKIN